MSEKKLPDGWKEYDWSKATEVRVFACEQMPPIEEHMPVIDWEAQNAGVVDPRKPRYFSSIGVTIQSPMGQQTVNVRFEIDATDLKDAFAKCPYRAIEAGEKWTEEFKTNQIKNAIVAGARGGPTTRQ